MKKPKNQIRPLFPEEYRLDIQAAIDAAWANKDPQIRAELRRRFPFGKPTPEIFIRTLAVQIRHER